MYGSTILHLMLKGETIYHIISTDVDDDDDDDDDDDASN